MAETLETVFGEIKAIQRDARENGQVKRPTLADDHPQDTEGLDGPEGDRRQEGRGISGARIRSRWRTSTATRRTSRLLEEWLRSYRAEELFDDGRQASAGAAQSWRPKGTRRMGANPHANGGLLLRDLRLPDFRDYAVDVPTPATTTRRGDACARRLPARRDEAEPRDAELPRLRARRARLEPPGRASSRSPTAPGSPRSDPGRRAPVARRPGDGDPQRAHMPGLARGLPADRPPRPLHDVRGVRPHRRLDVQPAREVAEGDARGDPVAPPDRVAELPPHAPTSGGRTTTASRTRIRASSTTS